MADSKENNYWNPGYDKVKSTHLAPMLFTAWSLNEQGVAGGSLCVSLNCLWDPQ